MNHSVVRPTARALLVPTKYLKQKPTLSMELKKNGYPGIKFKNLNQNIKNTFMLSQQSIIQSNIMSRGNGETKGQEASIEDHLERLYSARDVGRNAYITSEKPRQSNYQYFQHK